ncbi:tRNA 4-thiouridine(8) synthase ThiI [Candidatus Woesearchaeota archaeon]|nr:tRNA 4-thiouridine(8) synthase ThiI [Candidatus Woesearchaeota archaeon]
MKNKIKAVGLLSGGLDSVLAARLVQEENIDVFAISFRSPFFGSDSAEKAAKELRIPVNVVQLGKDYRRILRSPKHGYGAHMNPCIDCRVHMLKKAKSYAKKIGVKFIFTGEVLGQRPMTQNRRAMELIEKESGLKNRLLRPLSAKNLKETEAEKKGWIKRENLLAVRGRSRSKQLELAEKYRICTFESPAGGCLLTQKEFSKKVKDLFAHKKRITEKDMTLLKIGRHFRYKKSRIIVGRNERENNAVLQLKNRTDYIFEVPSTGSPITLLQGKKTIDAITLAAALTARYSDAETKIVTVRYGTKPSKPVKVRQATQKEIDSFRV